MLRISVPIALPSRLRSAVAVLFAPTRRSRARRTRSARPEAVDPQQGPAAGVAVLEVHEGAAAAAGEDEPGGLGVGVAQRQDADAAVGERVAVLSVREAHPDVVAAQ